MTELRLGLRENLPQFSLLVLLNAFVGAMVGMERTVLPLLGEQEFGLSSKTAITSFIVSFGVSKAVLNLVSARLSDRIGRKPDPRGGMALRAARAVPHHLRARVVVDRPRQRAPGRQPGAWRGR